MKHHLTPTRGSDILRVLVADAFTRSANAALLSTPNPHRNHPILGDPEKVDMLMLAPSCIPDRIIHSDLPSGRHAADRKVAA